MVNQSKDPKQQQLQNPSNNTAQDQNKILSSNTSANSSKEFDRQKFKEELLCKNGREKEWHLRLLENDRKQVENMMEEAVELQIHFQNFQREFNQISQTSSTMIPMTMMTMKHQQQYCYVPEPFGKDNKTNNNQENIDDNDETRIFFKILVVC